MMERKTPVIVSGFWQFVRFVVLVTSSILFFNPRLFAGVSLLLVVLAAPSLALGAGFLIAGMDSRKFSVLRALLVFGQALEILPGLLLLIVQGGAIFFGIAKPVFDEVLFVDKMSDYAIATEQVFYYALAGLVLVDLIFLLVLLSYGTEPDGPVTPVSDRKSAPGENLPG
ncbi:MAG: hypothetical protein JW852_02165 [Spirochaetales bacterium]|nr:hypothetical protein [Spirochaetales bacterium]